MSPAKRKETGVRGSRHAPPTNAFKAGEPSANPTGRPKLTDAQREAREARALAQPQAVACLVGIVTSETARDADKIAASKAILDGLEPLKLEMTGKDGEPIKSETTAPVVLTVTPERLTRVMAVLLSAGAVAPEAAPTEPEVKPE